jgi:hypothetical protein
MSTQMQLRNNKLVHMADGSTDNFTFTFDNGSTIGSEPTATVKGNLVPSTNDTYQMGTSSAKWTDIFTDTITSSSQVTNSDRNLKKNIEDLKDDENKILDVRPVSFNWKKSFSKNETQQYGFIAQEIQKIFPNLVKVNEDETLAVNYVGMIPLLIDHIKKLYKLLDEKEDKKE